MNNRLRQIREFNSLSRASFGERIGVSGDVINNLERGRVEIKEHMIKLICTEFNISEEWLRSGNGEMNVKRSRNQEIIAFTQDAMSDIDESFRKRFLSALSKLNESDWKVLEKIVDEMTKKED